MEHAGFKVLSDVFELTDILATTLEILHWRNHTSAWSEAMFRMLSRKRNFSNFAHAASDCDPCTSKATSQTEAVQRHEICHETWLWSYYLVSETLSRDDWQDWLRAKAVRFCFNLISSTLLCNWQLDVLCAVHHSAVHVVSGLHIPQQRLRLRYHTSTSLH